MIKIHKVSLTDSETKRLREYVHSGNQTARNIARAQMLLLSSEGRTDDEIAKVLHVCKATVYNTRRRFDKEGLDITLKGYAAPGQPP